MQVGATALPPPVPHVRVLSQPDVRKRLLEVGFDPIGNPSVEFAVYLKSGMIKWAKVIKDSGARVA